MSVTAKPESGPAKPEVTSPPVAKTEPPAGNFRRLRRHPPRPPEPPAPVPPPPSEPPVAVIPPVMPAAPKMAQIVPPPVNPTEIILEPAPSASLAQAVLRRTNSGTNATGTGHFSGGPTDSPIGQYLVRQ